LLRKRLHPFGRLQQPAASALQIPAAASTASEPRLYCALPASVRERNAREPIANPGRAVTHHSPAPPLPPDIAVPDASATQAQQAYAPARCREAAPPPLPEAPTALEETGLRRQHYARERSAVVLRVSRMPA